MFKRLIDISASAFGLFLLSPMLIAVAVVVRLTIGSPVLFRQQRPGLHGKPFWMYKFRTMTDGRDENGNLLPDEKRMTGFGSFLRKTSIDELPELINVLKGEMSIVGPRPLLMEYLSLYSPEQARRHEVKPGITGWAQVKGRNAISLEERFELDVWYVDHYSFRLDVKIILITIQKVFFQENIHFTEATMNSSFVKRFFDENPNYPTKSSITTDSLKKTVSTNRELNSGKN